MGCARYDSASLSTSIIRVKKRYIYLKTLRVRVADSQEESFLELELEPYTPAAVLVSLGDSSSQGVKKNDADIHEAG